MSSAYDVRGRLINELHSHGDCRHQVAQWPRYVYCRRMLGKLSRAGPSAGVKSGTRGGGRKAQNERNGPETESL